MSYELGLGNYELGQWEAAIPAFISAGSGLASGIISLFGSGKNKPKDCLDYCTGEKIGTMLSGTPCSSVFPGTAAADEFVGGKLPENLKRQFMEATGLKACIDRSGSGGTPTNVPTSPPLIGSTVGATVIPTSPQAQTVPVGYQAPPSGQGILSFISSPLGLIAIFGGILLLRRK